MYKTALESGLVRRVIYTRVHGMPEDTEFDAFFPEMKDEEWDCVPFFARHYVSRLMRRLERGRR